MRRLFSLFFMLFSFSFFSVLAADFEERPKVSIVIPVYNVEPWIGECMDSLVNQTLKEIEIICVDDGSPDNCGKILDEYAQKDSRVKVIHQQNSGVQRARNAGLDAAIGEYIALVDSDDYVDIHTYETAYNLAKKDNVDILNFKARVFDEGKDDHINNIDFSDSPVVSAEDYIQNNYRCWVWDNLFKNEIIQKDKIRFIPEVKPADDTCFTYMALGRAKTVKSIPATFYNYRMRPCALSCMTPEDVFINSRKMFRYICNSWRDRGCLNNNEHNLITLIIRWARIWGSTYLKYAQEVLASFGPDIYNPITVKKCPDYIQKNLTRLEYSAESNKNPPLESGTYRIATASSGYMKRLDISGGSKQQGANLQQWETNCSTAQDFEIIKHDEGYYTIKAVCSGEMLDVENGSQQAGANIRQWDGNDAQAQHWYIIPCGDGNFNVISECNLLAMDVMNASNNNGTNIHCWHINNSNTQKFKFIKVASKYNSDKETVSIAMATDHYYVYPTIVSMTSILENKDPDTKIDFYLMLSGDIDQSSRDKILSLKNKYSNCNITLIDMRDKFNNAYVSRNVTRATYYRLLLPSLIPNVDKILYMDTDMVIKTDLKKIFYYNMDNYYVAGVLDGVIPLDNSRYTMQQEVAMNKGYANYEELIGIPDMRQYINGGLCLFNLSKMRENNIEEKFINAMETHNYDWHDQDTINVVCYDKIRILPLKYNCMMHCVYSDNANILYSLSELEDARLNPQIIHYTGMKPWNNPYDTTCSSLWWEYAEKTDFFKEIQEQYLIKDGTYVISSALDDNKVLDISSASNKDGANLQLWDKNGTDAQKFDVKYVGNRCFRITAKCSNKAVDVSGAGKNRGTNVWQYTPNNTDAQQWYIIPCGDGHYTIVSKCNMLNLDVSRSETANGTNIHCWVYNGCHNQRFRMDRVS